MSLYDSISKGLNEAIDYERGELPNIKIDKISISPLPTYTGEKIKEIRVHQNMTQRLFAEVLGVSIKTVEAWEAGINKPTGTAVRLFQLLEKNSHILEEYNILTTV